MKASRLPISLCHASCPKCGLPTEFKMFESGAGGDFATFVGAATGAIYRLDLGRVHYQKISEASLLADAQKKEGCLRRSGVRFAAPSFQRVPFQSDGEEVIEAYEL